MSDSHDFAAQLGETERQPVALIGRIVRRLGHVQAGALLDRALAIEAGGGMLTNDGARRRTPGGVFFVLVKQHLEETGQAEAAQDLFPSRRRPSRAAAAPLAPPPPVVAVLRPRVRVRPGASPVPRRPEAPGTPRPLAALPADSHSALEAARQLLTAEMGCYAIGAHLETRTLRVRFAFPDTAGTRYAEQLAAVAQATGWRVELHPQPHQGRMAEAALGALPAGLAPAGTPSLRPDTRTVAVRVRGDADPGQLAAAQAAFHEQTGWSLAVERVGL